MYSPLLPSAMPCRSKAGRFSHGRIPHFPRNPPAMLARALVPSLLPTESESGSIAELGPLAPASACAPAYAAHVGQSSPSLWLFGRSSTAGKSETQFLRARL